MNMEVAKGKQQMMNLRQALLMVHACPEHQSGYFKWAADYPCCEPCLRLLEKEATKCEHNRAAMADFCRQLEKEVEQRLGAIGLKSSDSGSLK